MRRAHGGAACCPNVAVYVNGAIFSEGFAGLDAVLQMHEVLAIETYPDVLFAPVQWRGNLGLDATSRTGKSPHVCAVVVVWTKHQAGVPRHVDVAPFCTEIRADVPNVTIIREVDRPRRSLKGRLRNH